VAANGVAVAPYGITRVTANNEVIYEHEVDRSHVLVAPYVAAEMTDLLQTAVNTGTGRAAQIGRPVAGKTGTTSSGKDGWFLGFSSGITTGVWMGRDDARPIPGLHGGTAPAHAFAVYMGRALAGRAVEQFDTGVTLPDMQLEPDQDFGQPDNGAQVDADGNPVAAPEPGGDQPQPPQPGGEEQPAPAEPAPAPQGEPVPQGQSGQPTQRLDQDFIDRALGRTAPPPRPRPRRPIEPAPAPDLY
jgi:penicillin-binding protein 1A